MTSEPVGTYGDASFARRPRRTASGEPASGPATSSRETSSGHATSPASRPRRPDPCGLAWRSS